MAIDLVVFDLAGTTLYDGDGVGAAFRSAMAAAGVAADPALVNHVMGLPKPQAIRILFDSAGRTPTDAEVEAVHADFTGRMCHYYATDPAVREVPGAADVFAALRRAGVKVALNTGFYRPIAAAVLARLGWHPPVVTDADIASDEVPRGRPHPDMIRALMARLGVTDPRRVAKVGDTQADLEEGTNAGCGLVVGVTTGAFTRDELLCHPHTHIVESVADVPGLML